MILIGSDSSGYVSINGRTYAQGSLVPLAVGPSHWMIVKESPDPWVADQVIVPATIYSQYANAETDIPFSSSAALETFFQDYFFEGGGTSSTGLTKIATPPIGTPVAASGQITVPFTTVANANSYVAEASADGFFTIAGTNSGASSPIVVSVPNGLDYQVRLKGKGPGFATSDYSVASGEYSPEAAAGIPILSMPRIGKIIPGDESITVSLFPILEIPDSYTVQASADGFETIAGSETAANANSPFVVDGLTNLVHYEIRVFVTKSGYTNSNYRYANGEYIPSSDTVPQLGDTTLTATTISSSRIDLSATAVAGATKYKFERANDAGFTSGVITIQNTSSRTASNTGLTAATEYFYKVTPTASGFIDGTPSTASATTLAATNLAPVASSLSISGTTTQGQTLTGSYTYSDNESDPQGTSVKKWYRSDDTSGTNKAAISGATASTYILQAGDVGKFIQFAVTPVATSGTTPGTEAFSSYSAEIAGVAGDLTGYFLQKDNDVTPSESEILAGTAFSITPGSPYTITFPNLGPKNIMVFEPSTEPQKTKYNNTFGDTLINGENAFGAIVTVTTFRGYKVNYQTFFGTPITFKIS